MVVLLMILIGLCAGCSEQEVIEPVANFEPLKCKPGKLDIKMHSSVATIGMVGDILLHNPLYTYADFNPSFAAVKDKMRSIDFLLANQESLPGGVELGLSGYPLFNSPKHIIRDLKNNGVDMLSIANNHTMDQTGAGLLRAIANMKVYNMPYVGAYESEKDSETKRIVEVNGIQVGILAYTYGLNGMPTPAGKDYMVSLTDKQRIEQDIQDMNMLADLTVVSVHWGNEYALQPSEKQKELAIILASAGADIIFGHHPHVLQSYTEIGKTKVFYSIGNFYSAQQFDSTNIGGIAQVQVFKNVVAGRTQITTGPASFYPTAVSRDKNRKFIVVPLSEAGSAVNFNEAWVERQVGLSAN
ncbi:CapA family protein [Sporosarcina quadrami]|nr:CapA family protein [Sporosarcina quadrami]